MGREWGTLRRPAGTASLIKFSAMGAGVAGLLFGASSCDCCNPVQPVLQPTYACPDGSAVYCLRAQEALGSFLGSYTEVPGTQVATGETVQRLFSRGPFGGGGVDIEGLNILSDWAITWDDACAVEMIVDYYAATGDPTFNRIVEAYKSFEPIYFLGSSLVNPNDNPLGITGFPRYNSFNDDLLWWALAFVHAYENVPAPADSGSVRDLTYSSQRRGGRSKRVRAVERRAGVRGRRGADAERHLRKYDHECSPVRARGEALHG